MKKYSFYALLVLALMAMLVIGGCSKNSPNEPEENLDPIDQEYGGFSTADESPENYLLDDYDFDDPDVDDGISDDPEINALFDSNFVNIYYVRITWGMLEWDSTTTTTIDWSGSASINKGTLVVLRTIRFEPGQDHIVRPRPDRKTVEWVSYTMPHLDGIYIAIIDNDTSEALTEGKFTLSTGPYSNTFTFAELDSMELIETVDDLGNQISIISFNKKVIPFAGGFLEGRWVKDKPKGGRFWGRWIHSTGLRAGYLKGIWGVNRFGRQVFFGKYTSLNGRFKGLLRGNWGYVNEEKGHGWFKGTWVNASFTAIGTLRGHFKTGKPGDRRGYFRGRWHRKY